MRIQVLDGLRGYAALMIIFSHMSQVTDTVVGKSIYDAIDILHLGYLGVDLFFVLSGFLITRILIKEKKNGEFSFRLFYLKRSLRIFPIYYLTILVCYLLFSLKDIAYMATYISNFYFFFNDIKHPLVHTWSLSIEEHFYLLWPLLLYFIPLNLLKRYMLPTIVLIVLVSIIIAYSLLESQKFNSILSYGTQFRILSLSIGAIFAFHENKIGKLNKRLATRWLFVLGFIFYMLGIFSCYHAFQSISVTVFAIGRLFFFSICSSFFFLFVLIQESRGNTSDYLYSNKGIRYIGEISYGLYLYHYPIFFFLGISKGQFEDGSISFMMNIFSLVLTFFLAISSYVFIEKPIMKLKRQLVFKHKRKWNKL